MIPVAVVTSSAVNSIPRESGDDPAGAGLEVESAVYSPRERG